MQPWRIGYSCLLESKASLDNGLKQNCMKDFADEYAIAAADVLL